MQRVVFVDRMRTEDAGQIAGIWAEHDRTNLPARLGVTARTLFRFRGLYLHLVESSEAGLVDRIAAAAREPEYVDVRTSLSHYLRPFDEDCRGLRDTEADEFYRWRA